MMKATFATCDAHNKSQSDGTKFANAYQADDIGGEVADLTGRETAAHALGHF